MAFLVSFVVDAFAEHYHKAELLLFSLETFGAVPRANILVQCVDRVDPSFLDFLRQNGYRMRLVAPFLDGSYCNKLQQLPGLEKELEGIDGVFLLDIDMAAVAPLQVPDTRRVWGKVVDGPNPPLAVLGRIFAEALVSLPEVIPCDWGSGDTVATNFNGGFLFLPGPLAPSLSEAWRGWAQWLFQRPGLFDTPGQCCHIDQVSMALALAAEAVPCGRIAANGNFPAHNPRLPRSFDATAPVRLLHYHNGIGPGGLLQPRFRDDGPVDAAVRRFNEAAAERGGFAFSTPRQHPQISP